MAAPEQLNTKKALGKALGIVETQPGVFEVVEIIFKGKQLHGYKVLHSTTYRGDAKLLLMQKLHREQFVVEAGEVNEP